MAGEELKENSKEITTNVPVCFIIKIGEE